MKHIIYYKLFESMSEFYESDLEINYKMIRDLKDLCMEIFDNNYSLLLYLYIDKMAIGVVTMNHESDDFDYYHNYYYRCYDKKQKINYILSFISNEDHTEDEFEIDEDDEYYQYNYIDEVVVYEILEIIKEMYPEEEIKLM